MKQKVNLRLALMALIAIVATAIGLTLAYYNLFRLQVQDDLRVDAELLADTGMFQNLYAEGGQADIADFAGLQDKTLRITWIDADGSVLFDNDTDAGELANHLDRPEIAQALEQGWGQSVRNSDTMNMNTFYYALLLDDGTILRVSTQARTIFSVFSAALPVVLVISAAIAGVCILLGHLLTGQLLKPIDRMAEHLNDHVEVPVYKELQPFADEIRSQHENILAAARSRQDFTANVSHELKTPLTAISGYAELLENRMVDPEREVYIAGQIRHNADRLLSLINDIIRLSELDHTEIPRKFVATDLYDVTDRCCTAMQEIARQKAITLQCTGRSTMIRADADLISELIENLVQNAIRYNHEDGWVRVSVRIEGEHAVLTVSDNGIGIPPESQSRVFERFYRVDKSRSRETGGTGLGLAIVKHIAELHNAKITLESEVGRGTTISVTF